MSQSATPLSLRDLLLLIRYELRLTRDEMAHQCGLCPCCYADLESVADPDVEPELVVAIHEQLPHLSTLLRARRNSSAADGQGFEERLNTLENAAPDERAVTMTRIRLELQWLDEAGPS